MLILIKGECRRLPRPHHYEDLRNKAQTIACFASFPGAASGIIKHLNPFEKLIVATFLQRSGVSQEALNTLSAARTTKAAD